MFNKKALLLALSSVLLLSMVVPMAVARTVRNPGTMVVATIGMPETVDPAWGYDTASEELIFNVYETLTFSEVNRRRFAGDPQALGDFIPVLSTGWTNPKLDMPCVHNITSLDPPPLANVVGAKLLWQEKAYNITGWKDNGDIVLNASDFIWIRQILPAGPTTYRHVDKMEWDPDFDEIGAYHFYLSNPVIWPTTPIPPGVVSSNWTDGEGLYHCVRWDDNDNSGDITVSDHIWLEDIATGDVSRYHVKTTWGPDIEIDMPDTYIFKIRGGVTWHDGTVTTAAQLAADVEYSIERGMVQDRAWGPQWMFYEPLLDSWGADAWDLSNPVEVAALGQLIDDCVEDFNQTNRLVPFTFATGSYVTFNLAIPYPPFMQIISQPWASILHKPWVVALGGFLGFNVTGYDGWLPWHNPPASELDSPARMMGTGPYYFSYWTGGQLEGAEWAIKRHINYHRGWPAPKGKEVGLGFAPRLPDYVTNVIVKNIHEWPTRKLMFLAGDADIVYVSRLHNPEIEGQPGVLVIKDIPTLMLTAISMTLDVNPDSPYLGPGFNPADPYAVGDDRIPVDFFSDVAVRKAFAYCFNWTEYINDVWLGEAEQSPTPHIKGLVYWEYIWEGGTLSNGTYLPPIDRYAIDLATATTLMQGTPYWTSGFRFTITHSTCNTAAGMAAAMLKYAVESINPGKFNIDIVALPWATYLKKMREHLYPMFIVNWLADYPDPHNFMYPFAHSKGTFAGCQRYEKPELDALIDEAIRTPPGDHRAWLYWKASEIYHDDVPSLPLIQPLGRHYEQDWVQGWYYNALYGGSHCLGVESIAPAAPVLYFYHLYKAQLCDLNADGTINVIDASLINAHWYPIPPIGPGDFNLLADMNRDGRVDIVEAVIFICET